MRPTPPHPATGPAPALDEAGHYERPRNAPRGTTTWNLARRPPPETLPADSPIQHPPLILATARDPATLTWNPPTWPGNDPPQQPCWRAEDTTSGLTVTVAITEDGQITRAWIPQPARPSTDAPPLPAVIQHFAAMCHAREAKGFTYHLSEAPGHHIATLTIGPNQVTMVISRKRKRWDLTSITATKDGQLLDTARTIHHIIKLLTQHEIGTGVSSPTGAARLPRNSSIEAKKNTVIRV
ncbi:MAG TPA: hypothetical protein VMG38_19335 [Trebonia sp.]|nr:hypothetical protein [Trebonia sp.]